MSTSSRTRKGRPIGQRTIHFGRTKRMGSSLAQPGLTFESLEPRRVLSSLFSFLHMESAVSSPVMPPDPGDGTDVQPVAVVENADLAFLANNVDLVELAGLDRIDSVLLVLASRDLQGDDLGASTGSLGATTIFGPAFGANYLTDGTRPLVDVFVHDVHQAQPFLEREGMEVTAVADTSEWQIVEGFLPIGSIRPAAQLPDLIHIRPSERPTPVGQTVPPGGTRANGAGENEWEEVSSADQLKRVLTYVDGTTPFDGRIEVGLMSDSANQVGGGISDSQASGDLPTGAGRINLISDSGSSDSDEARAMAELIYDLCDECNFVFHQADGGLVDFANGFDDLRQSGANVIVDDFSYYSEPPFQDGVIANATEAVYLDHGVLTFGSAGNGNNAGYRALYNDGTDNDDLHNFSGGDETINITLAAGDDIDFALHWQEPWGSATRDIDIEIWNSALNAKLEDSNTNNVGGNPVDSISFANNTGSTQSYHVSFRHVSGPSPNGLQLQMFGNGDDDDDFQQYTTNEPHVAGNHAGSWNFAIGAVPWNDPNTIEGFSSRGPNLIYFGDAGTPLATPTTIQVPVFTAADGVETSFFGSGNNFFGTSAAAPNAAAVALLMLDAADEQLSRTELFNIFRDSAVGTGTGAWDNTHGWGRINALGAGMIAKGIDTGEFAVELNQFGDADISNDLFGNTDIDRFYFAPDSGGSTTIDVDEATAGFGAGATFWNKDSGGFIEIDYGDELSSADAAFSETLSTWVQYQVEVFSERDVASFSTDFDVVIDTPPPLISNISLNSTGDASSSQSISTNDSDYFTFTAPAGSLGTLTLTLAPDGNLDGVLSLFDALGNQIDRANSGVAGVTETLTYNSITPGASYTARVGSFNYASADGYTLDINLDVVPGHINLGTLSPGTINPSSGLSSGEIIWWEFTLADPIQALDGRFLVVDTLGSTLTDTGTGGNDTEIGLYDAAGNRIANNDDYNFTPGTDRESRLAFGADPMGAASGDLAAGTYYLATAGYNSSFFDNVFNVTSASAATGTIQVNIELVTASGNPADFDADGDVDGDDFLIWQANFPTSSGALQSHGDADSDGDVDGDDFLVWQAEFPFPGGGSGAMAANLGDGTFDLGLGRPVVLGADHKASSGVVIDRSYPSRLDMNRYHSVDTALIARLQPFDAATALQGESESIARANAIHFDTMEQTLDRAFSSLNDEALSAALPRHLFRRLR